MIVLPAPIVTLAQRQLGVVARYQLLRWLTADQVDSLVQRGAFTRLERGIYRPHASAVVPGQRALAATLRARPPSVLTGPAALGLHGVEGFGADDPFEVLTPAGRELRAARFPWRPDPRPERATVAFGAARVSVPEDALVHAVRWRSQVGDRALRLACDWLGWRGMLDRGAFLERLVARADVDADAAALLEILGGVELGRCESEGERRLGVLARRFDPAPRPQVWLSPFRRTDWYWDAPAVALEYDGAVDHAGERNQRADRRRDDELAARGVHVVHVTDDDLRDEAALLAALAATLTRRAVAVGVPAPRYLGPR